MNRTSIAQQANVESSVLPTRGILQRKCACGNHITASEKCGSCQKGKSMTNPIPIQSQKNEGSAENYTGMPGSLKTGLEALSGMDLSGVRVHRDSSKPTQMNALAYTQGQDIHMSPGQEKHLPHEGWHVVQQMQGRVNPTMHANGILINDDARLESEADVMGVKALQKPHVSQEISNATAHIHGNQPIQRNQAVVQRATLQEDVVGNMTLALSELVSAYDGRSGIIAQQISAVHDFTDAVVVDDPPSVTQQILVGAINLALGAALGSVGALIKTIGRRALRPALVAATLRTFGTGIDSSVVRSNMRSALDSTIDAMMSAGKGSVAAAVTKAFSGNAGTAPTPALKFRRAQEHALMVIGRAQTRQMHLELAGLLKTAGTEDEWAVINALYAAFQENLTAAYNEQYNKMTDVWFAMQVTSIGLGTRPGILQIKLADRFPHKGKLKITSGNLVGEGANATVRGRLSSRKLDNIGVPKVIRMNGSMGLGIIDSLWNISVTGQQRPSAGPVIGPTRSRAAALMVTDQHVTNLSGNRWGRPWLAAYHLNLSDLDSDDARNNSANRWSGARKVWSNIKDMHPKTIGNSSW